MYTHCPFLLRLYLTNPTDPQDVRCYCLVIPTSLLRFSDKPTIQGCAEGIIVRAPVSVLQSGLGILKLFVLSGHGAEIIVTLFAFACAPLPGFRY